MGPADAILATFADSYVPESLLEELKRELCEGSVGVIERFATTAPEGALASQKDRIDAHFAGETAMDIVRALEFTGDAWAQKTLKALRRNSPLSVGCTVEALHRARAYDKIELALALEYRFSYRCMEDGEFLEGVRAAVIDKDRMPRWSPAELETLSQSRIGQMLQPLGTHELKLG
jgi:enoyl-CoA hydratase/carnithine racemase